MHNAAVHRRHYYVCVLNLSQSWVGFGGLPAKLGLAFSMEYCKRLRLNRAIVQMKIYRNSMRAIKSNKLRIRLLFPLN